MEIGYMLSETFIINSVRDGDQMKIVLKEFNQSNLSSYHRDAGVNLFLYYLELIWLLKTQIFFGNRLAMVFMSA